MKDVLIIGQGIAGSLLGWELIRRGRRVTIVDERHKRSSSVISAGLINPVTGKRFAVVPRFDIYFERARHLYREIEERLGQTFFEQRPILRMFRNEEERDHWLRKKEQGLGQRYVRATRGTGYYYPNLHDDLGSVLITTAAHCRAPQLLAALADLFRREKVLIHVRFDYDDLKLRKGSVTFGSEAYQHVIFAEGYQTQFNPYFDWLPFNSVKGEILRVRLDGRNLPDAVLNKGKWAAPLEDGLWAAGSTYEREALDCTPTAQGKKDILRGLEAMVERPVAVIGHQAGVRPVVEDQMPVLGMHPQLPAIGIFNGLGSKGFLKAPLLAAQLADHLCKRNALPAGVEPARYTPVMN